MTTKRADSESEDSAPTPTTSASPELIGSRRRVTASPDLIGASMPREAQLLQTMVELADNIVADFDVVELFSRLTDRCVEVLDVSAAGIMLAAPDGALRVMASSSETMRLLELFELQSQEGPCLDCFGTGRVVANNDLDTADARWPRFSPEARSAGFASVHAFPMRLRESVIGALNLFHDTPGPMSQPDIDAAQALADIATIAILQHRVAHESQVLNEHLNHALNSRIVIEQAKGIISERETLDMDAAFRLLRNHARNHNLRLADLATSITTGALSASALDRLPPTK